MFVTAWIGELDLDSGRISYVNAGHNPPVMLRGGGKAEYLNTTPAIVLGAMSEMEYASQEVALAPGDSIYLYTDGVTEQTNPNGEMFGEDRLLGILSDERLQADPQAIPAAVSGSVSAFAAGTEQADDRTQLVIRYRGGSEKEGE